MESATSWEYKNLINELTQGREQVMQLIILLSSTPYSEPQDLLQKILSTYEKSLLILNWNGSLDQPQSPTLQITAAPESSISVDGNPRSDDLTKITPAHLHSKKRKAMPIRTEHVRINPQTGLEGPGDDGYNWRKYGQKYIQGTKYPRSYYRCTYRHSHNCWANKQVQRIDDDPAVFELTYKGTHTCTPTSRSPPPQPKKQQKQNYNHSTQNELLQPDQMLMHLRDNLRVKTDELETIKEDGSPFSALPTFSSVTSDSFPVLAANDHPFLGNYTPSFISPGSSESNYFSASSTQMNDYGNFHDFNHSESEQNGIFSANASSCNSPISGLEYFLDPVALDSNYPFDTTGFFS